MFQTITRVKRRLPAPHSLSWLLLLVSLISAAVAPRPGSAQQPGNDTSVAAASPEVAGGNATAPAAMPPFPDLVTAALPPATKEKWDLLGRKMWEFLLANDFDFVDADSGKVVPPTLPNAVVKQPVLCGRIARLWVRMPFHDCGTFDAATGQGGCNGSLRKELSATEPLLDPLTGSIIFNDTFEQLGTNQSRADYAFDPSRRENTGFAVSAAFYYEIKFAAEDLGLAASWADIEVLAGMLSVVACQGPHILFVPGRQDSLTADPGSMLPAPTATAADIVAAYQRNSLGILDGLVVQASHSVACFAAGCIDSTPNKLDTAWVKELLAWNGSDASRVCPVGANGSPTAPAAQCFAPFDAELLKSPDTLAVLQLLATSDSIANASQLLQHVVRVLQDTEVASSLSAGTAASGQGGTGGAATKVFSLRAPAAIAVSGIIADGASVAALAPNAAGLVLWKVNLCTPQTCDPAQWAFDQLFASAFYKLTALGLPDTWMGHDAALTGAASLDAFIPAVAAGNDDNSSSAGVAALSPQSAAGPGAAPAPAAPPAATAASQRSAAGVSGVDGRTLAVSFGAAAALLLASFRV